MSHLPPKITTRTTDQHRDNSRQRDHTYREKVAHPGERRSTGQKPRNYGTKSQTFLTGEGVGRGTGEIPGDRNRLGAEIFIGNFGWKLERKVRAGKKETISEELVRGLIAGLVAAKRKGEDQPSAFFFFFF